MTVYSADFLIGYISCALWSSTDDSTESGGKPLDENYETEDIAPETMAEFRRDCEAFQRDNAADLAGLDLEQCGHDFWLTRNRHGAGFWDRGLGEVGERLSKASRVYGSVNLMVGSDGKIHS